MRDPGFLGKAVHPKQLPLETWLPQQWEVTQFLTEGIELFLVDVRNQYDQRLCHCGDGDKLAPSHTYLSPHWLPLLCGSSLSTTSASSPG